MPLTDFVFDSVRPMLCETVRGPIDHLVGTHWFEEKVDGIRALAAVGPSGVRLVNRNHKDITARYPDLLTGGQFAFDAILDGEIVSMNPDHTFEDIAKRDRQVSPNAILRYAQSQPAMFVAFDLLAVGGFDVRGLTYRDRRAALDGLPFPVTNYSRTFVSPDPALYEQLKGLQREGVVAKRLTAPYMSGRQSAWLKHKVKYTVTAVASGYEPGEGKRAECGKFNLIVFDWVEGDLAPREMRSVGKVGSGFTDVQIAEFKALIDRKSYPIFEIECMGVTSGGSLRQPVFKGVRTDLKVSEVTTAQFDVLPQTSQKESTTS